MKNRLGHTLTIILLLAGIAALSLSEGAAQTPFWQQTALDSGRVRVLATNARGDIFAGVWDAVDHSSFRIYRSTNDGNTWDTLNIGYPDPWVYSIFVVPSVSTTTGQEEIYAVVSRFGDTTGVGIYYSSDNGDTWQRRSSFRFVRALITPDSGRSFLSASDYDGVSLSLDSCRTWVRLSPVYCQNPLITSLAISQQGSILAGHYRSCQEPYGILRSTDNGQTWTRHRTWSQYGADVRQFLIPPQGDIFSTADDGVNRSDVDGSGWISANNGIPPWAAQNMNAIAMDSNRTIYVGERMWGHPYGGVFRSTDNGQSWVQWNGGLDSLLGVYSLVVNSRGYVFAGGERSGVFRSVNPVMSVTQSQGPSPITFSLSQNYPNPFNPSTKITYRVRSQEFVELRVFDILGREVATLVNEVKEASEYTVEWNANNTPSGVYFYRLTAGTFSETKRLLLLK